MTALLETADAIGRRLVDEAIWHGRRCGWVGPLPGPVGGAPVYGGLGADLYGGTAGVGLALAELAAVTSDDAGRRTALGAIRHALSRAAGVPPEQRLGLYVGRLGVALAAARVGTALDEEEAIEGAAALVDLTRREGGVVDQFDLVFGRAGGVVALLALARFLADPRLLEWAARLGAELVATAERDDGACSWAAPGADGDANLTGLSHGAAGVGHALLELHLATGEAPFRETAVAAFAYERALFDAAAGNWLDVSAPDETGAAAEVRRFVVAWCHGAPGIALTRVRAVELLDDDDCRAEAIAGVGTTREAVRDDLAAGSGNYSLCHGMAGNAEILLLAHPTLDEGRHEDRALAVEVAEAGIERYAASGRWPGGQPEGETPGLMLGLAGTALFYLRLHDPSVPSVLLMGA